MQAIQNLLSSRLTRRLVGWFLMIALLPLAVGGYAAFTNSRSALRMEAEHRLIAVRDIKADEISRYFDERLGDVKVLANRPLIIAAARAFEEILHTAMTAQNTDETGVLVPIRDLYFGQPEVADAGDGSDFSTTHAYYHPYFQEYQQTFGYYDIFLVEPHAGTVIYSVFKEDDFGTSLLDGPYADTNLAQIFEKTRTATESGFVVLQDFAYYEPSDGPAAFVAAPIFDGEELVSVLIFQLPIDTINTIMQTAYGMGTSAETILISSDDFLLRSDSRFFGESTIFKEKVDTAATRASAAGETGVKEIVDYRGEISIIAHTPLDIPGVNWSLNAKIDQAEAFAPITRLTRLMLWIGLGSALSVTLVSLLVARSLTGPIFLLRDGVNQLAQGDLTHQVAIRTRDELGDLGADLNAALLKLKQLIASFTDNAVQVASSAVQLSATAEEVSRTSTSQQGNINNTASAMEEIIAVTQKIAQNAEQAVQAAGLSNQRAVAGADQTLDTAARLEQADAAMQTLLTRSGEIGDVVKLIREIAAQTNILALNAAIEAAGAGQAGARFNVVSTEIRELAGRTRAATLRVADLIQTIQTEIQTSAEMLGAGAGLAREANNALVDIVESSAFVGDLVEAISVSTEEHAATTQDIAAALEKIVVGSDQTTEAIQQTAQISAELSGLAERLRQSAASFKIK